MTYFLGIDTGGTFTDAVLLDAHKQVAAAAKSLTTRFDLAVGIGGALQQLPEAMLAQVELVSLSTTLTTNSVVEGKGSPVCVLLAGYDAAQIKSSGLVELLGADAIVSLSGGHDAGGFALVPLDKASARAAIMRHGSRRSPYRPVSVCATLNTSFSCAPWSRRCATSPSPAATNSRPAWARRAAR